MSEPEFSLDKVARYWDGNTAAWAREVRQGQDIGRELLNNPAFLALVGDLRGRQVLDAGCGGGHNTRILARAGAHMTGVALSARMIELAQEEERRAPLGIRYARASYTDLALFAGAAFDAVVSFMAMMDGPRFDLAVAECFRVLRPGGRLDFSITHPCFLTRGSRWIRNEQGVKVSRVVGNYFDPTRWVERFRFTDAPVEAPEFVVPRFDRSSLHTSTR